MRVQGFFQAFIIEILWAAEDILRFHHKGLVTGMQLGNRGFLFLIHGQFQEFLEVRVYGVGIDVVFLLGLRVLEEVHIEQFFHLAIEIATGLLDFLHHKVDALGLLRGLIPDAHANHARRTCQDN